MDYICNTADRLELGCLIEFQGGLKQRTAEDIEKIKKSIHRHGFAFPFFVWSHGGVNHVLDGHGRIQALKQMEKEGEAIPPLPVVYIDCRDEAEAKELLLKLNSHYGQMTADSVLEFIGDIDINLDDLALPSGLLDLGDIADTDDVEEVTEDEVPEEPQEPSARLGDVYRLGRHRLICGDSTDSETIARLMDGAKADMVFTDPPYGMKKEKDGVLNDNLNFDDLLEFNKKWIPLSFAFTKENGSWYCWGIDEPLMDIYSEILKPMARRNEITFRNLLTWDKGNGQGQLSEGFRMYPVADEKCLFVMCGVQGFNNNQDYYFDGWEPIRSYCETEIKKIGESDKKIAVGIGHKDARTVNHWYSKSQWEFINKENVEKVKRYAKSKNIDVFLEYEKIKKDYEKIKHGYDDVKNSWYQTRAYFDNTHDNMNNVWHFERASKQEREGTGDHATPKPIALCARAIKSSSRPGEIVLDFFGGSGSTLIACEQTGRRCYMCELEPRYIDVIIQRWETLTGEKAELLERAE